MSKVNMLVYSYEPMTITDNKVQPMRLYLQYVADNKAKVSKAALDKLHKLFNKLLRILQNQKLHIRFNQFFFLGI